MTSPPAGFHQAARARRRARTRREEVRSCPASPRILLLGMDSGHPWGLSFLQGPSLPCAAQLLVPTAMPKLCAISRGHFSPAWRRSRSRDDNPPKQCWGRAAGRRCGNREEPGTAEILPGSESGFPHLLGLHKICGKFYTRRCGEDKHQSKTLGEPFCPAAARKPGVALVPLLGERSPCVHRALN